MQPAGNTYDDSTNTMTVGAVDNCLTSGTANNSQHNHTAHLVVQDVEDLVGWQARMNYDGGRMRPSTVNVTPFTDNTTGENVSFLNLPLEAGNHRAIFPASNIPPQAPTFQTALVGATYSGVRNAVVSPDTPPKSPPDDSSYGVSGGGVLASLNLQVLSGQANMPSLYIDLDDGSPNGPGSNVIAFTGSGTITIELAESALGDGFHGEGNQCLALGPVPPPPTVPPLVSQESSAAENTSDLQGGLFTASGPQQVNVSTLPQEPSGDGGGDGGEVESQLAPGPSEPGPVASLANAVDSASSPPGLSAANFEGPDNNTNAAVGEDRIHPPDPQMAVGPTHVFAMVNKAGRIYTRTGSPVRTFALAAFFVVPGAPGVPGSFIGFDPKLIYDDLTGRWFASYVSLRNLDGVDEGRLHLAVSHTSDPTSTWNIYYVQFLHDFPDYAGMGLTNDKVTISANRFDIDTRVFQGEQTIVFEKADLLSGRIASAFAFAVRADRFTVRPAHSLSGVNDQYLVTRGHNPDPSRFCDDTLASVLTLIRITGTPDGTPVTEASALNLAMQPQTQPPTVLQQPGLRRDDLLIDCRILEAVWRNGPGGPRLWASATTGCRHTGDPDLRSCAHLLEVSTGTPSVSQDIVFGAPQSYYTYPAVRSDASGDLYVSVSRFSNSNYPEARVAGRRLVDAPNTMTGSIVVRAGDTWYCTGCGTARWGDYMGAAVDPKFPDCVWLIGEYSKNIATAANWGTYIAATSRESGGGACLDSDNDGWTDAAEAIIGTDPFDACADTSADNAWPADFNNDRISDITEISALSANFGSPVPPAPARHNIAPDAPDGFVDVTDLSRLSGLFGQGCT